MIVKKEIEMKSRFSHVLGVFILIALFVVYSGCTSSPQARFYLLTAPDTQGPERKASVDERCLSLGVGPMTIPDYLDRPQIVTRTTPNEISLAKFDRWSESLKDNITRVLAKNLSLLLCTKTIAVFPWREATPIDYRIEMQILRLDGSLGGNVFLEASWMIFSGDGKKMLLAQKSSFTETTAGKDYNSLVSAQSRALHRLSNEIAEAIRSL